MKFALKNVFYVSVLLLLVSSAYALTKPSEWISVEVTTTMGYPMISSPIRKWVGTEPHLVEVTSTNFQLDCKAFSEIMALDSSSTAEFMKNVAPRVGALLKFQHKTEIDLLETLVMKDSSLETLFSSCLSHAANDPIRYQMISKAPKAITYEAAGKDKKIIFFKNPAAGFTPVRLAHPHPFLNGTLRTQSVTYDLYSIPYDKNTVMNMRSAIPNIIFDTNFPATFIPETMRSLKKWNSMLKFKGFSNRYTVKPVDPLECFSTRSLCLSWRGPETLAWAGLGAYSDASFDPTSGEVIGGLITFTNTVTAKLSKTPLALANKFISDDLSVDEIAKLYLSRHRMLSLEHPAPNFAIGSMMMHEIGHFVGLNHNFAGSNDWAAHRRPKTVMDYLPFPALNKSSSEELDWDRGALAARRANRAMPSDFKYCSDATGDQVTLSLFGKFEDPNCKKGDLGDPLAWAFALARHSAEGLMDFDANQENLGNKKFPILRHFGIFFYDGLQSRPGFQEAHDFVCKSSTKELEASFVNIFATPLLCD